MFNICVSLKSRWTNNLFQYRVACNECVDVVVCVLLDAFAKLRKATISFITSVCSSAWNNSAPTGRSVMKFNNWAFSKLCRQKWSLIKIREEQRVLYTEMFSHLWQYLDEFFVEWETFEMEVVEKIKTHFMFSILFVHFSGKVRWRVKFSL